MRYLNPHGIADKIHWLINHGIECSQEDALDHTPGKDGLWGVACVRNVAFDAALVIEDGHDRTVVREDRSGRPIRYFLLEGHYVNP